MTEDGPTITIAMAHYRELLAAHTTLAQVHAQIKTLTADLETTHCSLEASTTRLTRAEQQLRAARVHISWKIGGFILGALTGSLLQAIVTHYLAAQHLSF